MPKIPTFTTQARPTAEVGSTTATVSVPLTQTIGSALKPAPIVQLAFASTAVASSGISR